MNATERPSSPEDFARVAEETSALFATVRPDRVVRLHGPEWARLGVDLSRGGTLSLGALLHGEDLPHAEAALGALEGPERRKAVSFDARISAGGKSAAWLRFRAAPGSAEGEVRMVATDVTDLKAPASTAAELRLFRRMLESAPMVLWALDREGRFTHADGKGLAALGSKPGAWVGRDALQDWKGTSAHDNMKRALAGEEFRASLDVPGPLFYDVWYLPLPDAEGGPDGMMGLALDVTRERLVEADLRDKLAMIERQQQTIELFTRALNSAPVVLWSIDKTGRYTISEGKGLAAIGFNAGEAVGLNALEMFRGTPIESAIGEALNGVEQALPTEPAPGVFFDNWYIPLRREGSDEVHGVLGLAIDSTRRVQGERELREKLELIERQHATIRALATPIINVWEEVLVLPVVGTVDSQRTADMMDALLSAIVRERARFAVVDLTGVEVVDTSTADHIIKLFKSAKVLGVDGVLCGIQPAVAQTVIALGIELGGVRTMRTLEDALRWCIGVKDRRRAGRAKVAIEAAE